MGYLERTRDLFVGEEGGGGGRGRREGEEGGGGGRGRREGKEVACGCVVGIGTKLQHRPTYPHVWSFVPGP